MKARMFWDVRSCRLVPIIQRIRYLRNVGICLAFDTIRAWIFTSNFASPPLPQHTYSLEFESTLKWINQFHIHINLFRKIHFDFNRPSDCRITDASPSDLPPNSHTYLLYLLSDLHAHSILTLCNNSNEDKKDGNRTVANLIKKSGLRLNHKFLSLHKIPPLIPTLRDWIQPYATGDCPTSLVPPVRQFNSVHSFTANY